MTYVSWQNRYRVQTITPGPIDLAMVTLIDGRFTAFAAVTEYDEALAAARAFHDGRECQIKVLPLTAPEISNMLGIGLPGSGTPGTAAERQEVTDLLVSILKDSGDTDARRDAFRQLERIGVIKS